MFQPVVSDEIQEEIEEEMNNIEDMEMKQNQKQKFVDGQNVKYAGIITSIKKKYTKNKKAAIE